MARKRKQQGSNIVGWMILGAIGLGIYYFGMAGNPLPNVNTAPLPARVVSSAPASAKPAPAKPNPVPLSAPRFVNVAELNVRHTPSTSGPLIMTLPRGTQLKVLGRKDGWLLIDINPTLEGWVAESLTTTESPRQGLRPPAGLNASR